MKAKIKNKEFLGLLAGGAVIVIVALILGNKVLIQRNNQQNTLTSVQTTLKVEDYFNKETRKFVSPIIEIEPGVKRKFALELPNGWEFEGVHPQKFVSGDYSINIYDEYEGFNCLFDKQQSGDQVLSLVQLKYYSDVDTPLGSFKVGSQITDSEFEKSTRFIFCRPYDNTVTGRREWISGSEIGLITFKTPLRYDNEKVEEMARIINSIQVIKL